MNLIVLFMQLPASRKIYWTRHAREKMRYYQLSEARLTRILRYPKRVEEGVAEKTMAAMQSAGSRKHPYEVWLMYQTGKAVIRIISAWRYPGVTKPGERVPIPEDILRELRMETDK